MNELQKRLSNMKVLVFAMDQDEILDHAQGDEDPVFQTYKDAISGGFCSGLALRWVVLRYKGKTFKYNEDREYRVLNEKAAMIQQHYVGSTARTDIKLTEMFGKFGLTLNSGQSFTKDLPPSRVSPLIAQKCASAGWCYYLHIQGKTAHALGCYRGENQRRRLFDPNVGEILTRTKEEWVTAVELIWASKKYSKYDTMVGFGINPPPYINEQAFTDIKDNRLPIDGVPEGN